MPLPADTAARIPRGRPPLFLNMMYPKQDRDPFPIPAPTRTFAAEERARWIGKRFWGDRSR